ncbi:MAG: sugar MFS transporter [Flavobacteriales bacterium]|nr:sugar MFS transporter [Flavobacteriales bacterium]MBK9288644.1 sugar MFS transporter [Flavobacteriales bacterium]MBL0036392.1 sugar MFS transporter [Flavobacteriales bacterium]
MSSNRGGIMPIIILGILFFIFGFVTWLNGSLIPYLKIACELTAAQALLVTSAFYISYFVMALPMARVLRATGFKNGMMVGLLVMAAGALLFIPAAMTRTYAVFLLGLFVIGTGLTLLQTASNPYITIVGPIESAAQRISIMGICNKLAGMAAPSILAAVILHDADTLEASLAAMTGPDRIAALDDLALRVINPYAIMAGALVVLALFVRFSPLPDNVSEDEATHASGVDRGSVMAYPQLVFGAVAIFFYVGAEVIAGDAIGLYGQSQGIPLSETKNFTSWTMGAMLVGYVIGILTIPKFITQARALMVSSVAGIALACAAMLTSGYTSVLCIALLGLANALMWPAIWPLAIEGLGKYTKTGSALLIMGIVGGAVLTPMFGALSDSPAVGSRMALLIFMPCYLFIGWYAVKGHKLRSWS